jgi:hypothetical protein
MAMAMGRKRMGRQERLRRGVQRRQLLVEEVQEVVQMT